MGLNRAGQEGDKMLRVNAMAENAIFRATRALPCARYPRPYPAEVPCDYPEVPCGDPREGPQTPPRAGVPAGYPRYPARDPANTLDKEFSCVSRAQTIQKKEGGAQAFLFKTHETLAVRA